MEYIVYLRYFLGEPLEFELLLLLPPLLLIESVQRACGGCKRQETKKQETKQKTERIRIDNNKNNKNREH